MEPLLRPKPRIMMAMPPDRFIGPDWCQEVTLDDSSGSQKVAAPLRKGGRAWYRAADGQCALVDILNVHHDDEQPYYTIHLSDGVERSTVGTRLQAVSEEELAKDEARMAQAVAAADAYEQARLTALAAASQQQARILEERAKAARTESPPPRRRTGSTPRAASAPKRRPPASVAAQRWHDEKAAEEGGRCMACKGKKKSIYRVCAECTRMGKPEHESVLCASCCRGCETCEVYICPPCKRNVHTSCGQCGVRCRRRDFRKTLGTLSTEACCTCKR